MLPQHPYAALLQRFGLHAPLLLLLLTTMNATRTAATAAAAAFSAVDSSAIGQDIVRRDDAEGGDFAVLFSGGNHEEGG